MRTRHARQIRRGIVLFRLNWPRFSYRNAVVRESSLTIYTWASLERAMGANHG